MGLRLLGFLAVVTTALALVPSGAHLFESPNKIGLPREAYATAQGLYRGWAWFGVVLFAAIGANLGLAVALRRAPRRAAARWARAAGLLLVAALLVFLARTLPANRATENWTRLADDWDSLRSQWEYSHAAGAVLTFLALCAAALSVLHIGGRERDGTP